MWNACGSSCREPECSLPVAKGFGFSHFVGYSKLGNINWKQNSLGNMIIKLKTPINLETFTFSLEISLLT